MSSEVTVNELARELGLPASVLLEECHRLSIDAGWAGGTLTPQEAHVLRGRLATTEGLGPLAPWPPTAPAVPPGASAPRAAAAGPRGRSGGADPAGSDRPVAGPARRFDDTARTAAIAGIVGVVLLLVAPISPHVLLTMAAWGAAAIAGLVAVVAGNRSRYKISTRPERFRGMEVALTSIVVGLLVVVGIGLGTWAVVRTAPRSDGPTVVTGRADVGDLRWSYQRLRLIAEHGWTRPVKDVGTCWRLPAEGEEPAAEGRVEVVSRSASCRSEHDAEVLGVFAVRPEADVAYPGAEALIAVGERRCAPVVAGLPGDADVPIAIEYPTEAGWGDADHDVACVALVTRRGSLTDAPAASPVAEAGD